MFAPSHPPCGFPHRIEGDTISGDVVMDMRCPIQREEHLQWVEDRLAEEMWSNVTKYEANSGLWGGEAPLMEPTRKIHQKSLAEGRIQAAMALQAAVTHNVWCAPGASGDPLLMRGPRCGGENETLLHRRWTCPDNCNATHPAIRSTQHLIPDAVKGCENNFAFWVGWLRTGSMVNPKVCRVPIQDCITTTEDRFAEILKLTGVCGRDGSGGKNSSHPRCRAVGAGCGTLILRGQEIDDEWIQEEAWMVSKVPGRQTVPRAEIWAVLMVLLVWDGAYDLAIITDASYTVKGMEGLARLKNSRGPNRDIWTLIYAQLDSKGGGGILSVVKVKSYIEGVQAYCRNTPLRHIMVNELADFAAERFSDHTGNGKADKAKYYASQALLGIVCKRIAAVEASNCEYATDAPQVAADIVATIEVLGEQRRWQIREARDRKI